MENIHGLRFDKTFGVDLVCSWRCPVNSYTDVTIIMMIYSENASWVTAEFFALATGQNWKQG